MKFKKIEFARQTNFILGLLLVHFVFFGYLANIFHPPVSSYKGIGERILFLYQVLFSPYTFLSAIILGVIVFIMAFREQFFEYGIRNSIWLIPFIIIESWIWYWFIIEEFDITVIGMYFIRIESYITIVSLFGINLFAAFLASIAKEKYKTYLKRVKVIKR
ncbi:MAG: hypothetical protein ACFFBY_13090 [Promethearchaeota archaeon]